MTGDSGCTKIYAGRIRQMQWGDNDDALFIDDTVGQIEPIACVIETDMDFNGRYLSVRYWISDTHKSKDQATDDFIASLLGVGEAEYNDHYSEITGYLWTDETLTVGGHDLLAELRSFTGKWCILEIDYSRQAA